MVFIQGLRRMAQVVRGGSHQSRKLFSTTTSSSTAWRRFAMTSQTARALRLVALGVTTAALVYQVTTRVQAQPLLLNAKAAAAPPAPPKEITQVVEPSTGVTFPSALPSEPSLQLVGVGCRKKYGLAKIYAVGIYVLAKPKVTGEDQQLEQLISPGGMRRGILLKMYREVGAEQLVEALESSLKPRLVEPGSTAATPEASDSLAKMRSLLLSTFGPKIKVGTEILFIVDPTVASGKTTTPPTLSISIMGTPLQKLTNTGTLNRALMDVYIGKSAVVPELRGNVAKGLAKLP